MMTEAGAKQFGAVELEMMRRVIRYIDNVKVQKMTRILGAEGGLAIDHPVAQIGGMTATMHAAAICGNTMMNALLQRNPNLSL